ncbi:dephospho-CoA kinase [Spiroplasma endosymbiont of Crioceris asparagi]|uniref:dephospho-CoA kinase n=1 Tax=Spiroplasma endosymbiont of Crioceris asparagi TaxID=3066286 RepID=UPI0030D0B59B
MIVGISGNIGSGKTIISKKVLEKLDKNKWKLIEVDQLNSLLYKDKVFINFVKDNFGADIFANNEINKDLLKKNIFKDKTTFSKFSKFAWLLVEKYLIEKVNKEFNYLIDGAIIYQFKNIKFDKLFFIQNNENIANAIKRSTTSVKEEILFLNNFQESLKKSSEIITIKYQPNLSEIIFKKIMEN